MKVLSYLGCGCAIMENGERHWCPSCLDHNEKAFCPWCGGTADKPRKRSDCLGMLCAHEIHGKRKTSSITFKRYVMKFSDGRYWVGVGERSFSLAKARLYDLSFPPSPRNEYTFVPVNVTIEEV